MCEWETDGGQTHVTNTRFPMIHLSLFVSSMQQSVFLAVMKNMASVTNLESASKLDSRKLLYTAKQILIIVFFVFVMNTT